MADSDANGSVGSDPVGSDAVGSGSEGWGSVGWGSVGSVSVGWGSVGRYPGLLHGGTRGVGFDDGVEPGCTGARGI